MKKGENIHEGRRIRNTKMKENICYFRLMQVIDFIDLRKHLGYVTLVLPALMKSLCIKFLNMLLYVLSDFHLFDDIKIFTLLNNLTLSTG